MAKKKVYKEDDGKVGRGFLHQHFGWTYPNEIYQLQCIGVTND